MLSKYIYILRVSLICNFFLGLWYGTEKPAAETFFAPMSDTFHRLARGATLSVAGENIRVLVFLRSFTSDIPAKSLSLNMNQVAHYLLTSNCVVNCSIPP